MKHSYLHIGARQDGYSSTPTKLKQSGSDLRQPSISWRRKIVRWLSATTRQSTQWSSTLPKSRSRLLLSYPSSASNTTSRFLGHRVVNEAAHCQNRRSLLYPSSASNTTSRRTGCFTSRLVLGMITSRLDYCKALSTLATIVLHLESRS